MAAEDPVPLEFLLTLEFVVLLDNLVLKLVLHTHCLFLTFLGSSYHYHSCKSDHNKLSPSLELEIVLGV